jgi:hypothetical protein
MTAKAFEDITEPAGERSNGLLVVGRETITEARSALILFGNGRAQ